jgi:hypothetical protein
MWVDAEAEVRTRMRDRMQEAEQERRVARARASRTGRPLGGYGWRLRQAAGFGLVRTGLRLLDAGRAWS